MLSTGEGHFTYIAKLIPFCDCQMISIEPPKGVDRDKYPYPYLGISPKGVYYALVDHVRQLRVWFLNESCGQMEWVLRHDNSIKPMLPSWDYIWWWLAKRWTLDLQHVNSNGAIAENKFELDSDSGNVLEDTFEEGHHGSISILSKWLSFHDWEIWAQNFIVISLIMNSKKSLLCTHLAGWECSLKTINLGALILKISIYWLCCKLFEERNK